MKDGARYIWDDYNSIEENAGTDINGAGQQCVYDSSGDLINRGSGAGTPDRYSPSGFSGTVGHYLIDVAPYMLARVFMGFEKAEKLDHKLHPPNQGRDSNGNPCPPNDGSKASRSKCNQCKQ